MLQQSWKFETCIEIPVMATGVLAICIHNKNEFIPLTHASKDKI
jgi:hypothetical protein